MSDPTLPDDVYPCADDNRTSSVGHISDDFACNPAACAGESQVRSSGPTEADGAIDPDAAGGSGAAVMAGSSKGVRRPAARPRVTSALHLADRQLYYGDNLPVLRDHFDSESVDLIYLDPPFNSNQDYNVLFREYDGTQAAAQVKVFRDTWRWDETAAAAYRETVERGGRVGEALQAFRVLVGDSDMLAYLAMMAPRLLELHRVLKSTGSLYLHCDPTASHYLKLLLDAVFGAKNFRNEIVWKRTAAHSDAKQGAAHFGRVHDVLLFYAKSPDHTFNVQWLPYDKEYMDSHYRHVEQGTGRRYRKDNLTANRPGGDTSYEWKGVRPYRGRFWAYSKAKMEQFESEGRLVYTSTGMPEYKRYLDEMPGRPA